VLTALQRRRGDLNGTVRRRLMAGEGLKYPARLPAAAELNDDPMRSEPLR